MGRKRIMHLVCKCGQPTASVNTGFCRECRNAYQRANRKRHSELTPEQRKKANARSYLHVYIKRGVIIKKPCSICGNEKAQAHHPDYDKPLEVIWLCKKHHLQEHDIILCEIKPESVARIRMRKGQRKKTCSKCNEPLEASRIKRRYCKKCHAAYMKAHRAAKSNEK